MEVKAANISRRSAVGGLAGLGMGCGLRNGGHEGGRLTVEAFGARGDGVADDTAAISAALAALARLKVGTLHFAPGVYRVTGPIDQVFPNDADITIHGERARLDARAVRATRPGAPAILRLGGYRVGSVGLSESIAKGTDRLRLAPSPDVSMSTGDIVLVTSSELFNPTRRNYLKGELGLVEVVTGSDVLLRDGSFDAYDSQSTQVVKLAMPSISIRGLEIVGDANHLGLVVQYARNVRVRECRVSGARYCGIQLDYVFGGAVDRCVVRDAWYPGTQTSYGATIAACQDVVVRDCMLSEARHCLTAGGAEPARRVVFQNNNCRRHPREDSFTSIDSHENVEFITISGNVCDGISVGAIDADVIENVINSPDDRVVGLSTYYTSNVRRINISRNSINLTGAASVGISITADTSISDSVRSVMVRSVIIESNNVRSNGSCVRVEARNERANGVSFGSISLKKNALISESGLGFAMPGIPPVSVESINIEENHIVAHEYDAIFVDDVNDALITSVVANRIFGNRANGRIIAISGRDVNIAENEIRGNYGGSGNSRSVYYGNTGAISSRRNLISGVDFPAEISRARIYDSVDTRTDRSDILNPSDAEVRIR